MSNTVSREVYEAALQTMDDQQAIIEELSDEINRINEQCDRLKRILSLVINRSRISRN